MTKEEFYAKYGDVVVAFSSYFKYTFTYSATLPDGKILTVYYGGNSDDIYKHECFVGRNITVLELEPYAGCVYRGAEEMESFYDY